MCHENITSEFTVSKNACSTIKCHIIPVTVRKLKCEQIWLRKSYVLDACKVN